MLLRKKDLHNYQNEASGKIVNNPKSGLLSDMGLGKTIKTLTAIVTVKKHRKKIGKKLLCHIVVAPPRVVENVWREEALKWKHTCKLTFCELMGTPAEREKLLTDNIGKVDIFIMSVNLWEWLASVCIKHNTIPFDWLICDESHYYKNDGPDRSYYAIQLASMVPRVTLLTGTPNSKGYHNLYNQMAMLTGKENNPLAPSYSAFLSRYFHVDHERHITTIRDKECKRVVEDLCRPYFFRYDKRDHLKEIKSHHPVILLRLPKNVRKHYQRLKNTNGCKALNVFAESNAVKRSKLSQIANGRVLDMDEGVVELHNKKTEALKELTESNANLLVGYHFRADREHILNNIPRAIHYRGDKADYKHWNKNPNTGLVYVASAQSVGTGLNMQSGGCTIIWYSLPIGRRDDFDQFNARVLRQGQTKPVSVYHFIMRDTVDVDIYAKMIKDGKQQQEFLDQMKNER